MNIDYPLAVGVLALAVATPSLFQAIWGKPKIAFKQNAKDVSDTCYLNIDIRNIPISNSFLKWMGVHRSGSFHY